MKILLTNDDGFGAEGIEILEKELVSRGHEITVVAPSVQMSGKSHSMTLDRQVILTEDSPGHYHLTGTPSDCVFYGLRHSEIGCDFDLVLSGINKGYNLSSDVLYSGTFGAAEEAVLMGYRAIAVSAGDNRQGFFPFEDAARFTADNLERFLPLCTELSVININVPPHSSGRWDISDLGVLRYDDRVLSTPVSDNERRLVIDSFGPCPNCRVRPTMDFVLCKEKSTIAVSSIQIIPSINMNIQQKLKEMAIEDADKR